MCEVSLRDEALRYTVLLERSFQNLLWIHEGPYISIAAVSLFGGL